MQSFAVMSSRIGIGNSFAGDFKQKKYLKNRFNRTKGQTFEWFLENKIVTNTGK